MRRSTPSASVAAGRSISSNSLNTPTLTAERETSCAGGLWSGGAGLAAVGPDRADKLGAALGAGVGHVLQFGREFGRLDRLDREAPAAIGTREHQARQVGRRGFHP